MTLEKLAAMVQHGFSETATKAELGQMATKADLAEFGNNLRNELRKELASKEDLRELREELLREFNKFSGGWSEKHTSLHEWIKDIDNRLMILESKPKRR
jgi:hypothetical protein